MVIKSKKAQTENLFFSLLILITGLFFILLWAVGEALSNTDFVRFAQIGITLLVGFIELVKFMIDKFFR